VSRRIERLSSLIQRIIADEIQRGLGDPRIAPLTSITRVEISPDLSSAKVFVSVFGEETAGRLTVQALASAAGRLRAVLADQISIRTVPRLTFKLDESLKRGFEVVQMIDREMAEINARAQRATAGADEPSDPQEAT
jgi:ribosome-binding factor A